MGNFDNLITNPTFDANTTGWTSSVGDWLHLWSRDASEGKAGAGSLKHTAGAGDSTSVYQNVTLNGTTGSGGRYLISCWVKTAGLVVSSGIGAKLVVSAIVDPNTNIADVAYSTGLVGTNDWTLLSVITPWIPKTDALGGLIKFLRIYMRCDNSTGGVAYFDDISCTLIDDVKFEPILQMPNYNSIIYRETPQECIVSCRIESNIAYPAADLTLKGRVNCADGTVLNFTDIAQPADGVHKLTKSLDGKPDGAYSATVELWVTGAETPVKSETLYFTKNSNLSIPVVFLDKKQRIRVNNKPFFGLGAHVTYITDDAARAADTAKLVNAGINVVAPYTFLYRTSTHAKILQYLNEMQAAGIKVLFNLVDCRPEGSYPITRFPIEGATYTAGEYEVIKEMVRTYKDHPAVLAWYLNEEGTSALRAGQVKTAYDVVKSVDTDHPCLSLSRMEYSMPRFPWDYAASYRDIADVHSVQLYPIRRSLAIDYAAVAQVQLKSAMQDARSRWQTLETTTRPASTTYTVTQAEMLCEAYQALCAGARGLMWFYWTEMLLAEANSAGPLAALTAVITHLRALRSIAVAQDAPIQVTATAGIKTVTRVVDGDLWVLATNPTVGDIVTTFSLPEGIRSFDKAVQGLPGGTADSPLSVADNVFGETIGAGAVKCYRLYLSTLDIADSSDFGNSGEVWGL